MGTILAFVDGVGAGERNPALNPLARQETLLSFFSDGSAPSLPRGGAAALVDACLGVEGRPQSATGQSTIYTGVNAPAAIGKHLLGFPNAALRKLLGEHSLFRGLVAAGATATFANAYPTGYCEALGLPHRPTDPPEPRFPEAVKRRLRPSASTCAVAAANLPLRNFDDLRAGRAMTPDLRGHRARERGFRLDAQTPESSARAVLSLSRDHTFVLAEHFLLDELGHAQDAAAADRALADFDLFLRTLVEGLAPDDHLLVVSDHGNFEDLSKRTHTRNPVPFLAFGPRAATIVGRVQSLVDVRPAVFLACGLQDPAPPPAQRAL